MIFELVILLSKLGKLGRNPPFSLFKSSIYTKTI